MVHKEFMSKRVRIKFKNSLEEFEGIITFFINKGSSPLTRTPTSQYTFRLNDINRTEIPFEFYAIDTIVYL